MSAGELFTWHSFGQSIAVETLPDGAVAFTLVDDDDGRSITLPTGARDELVSALVDIAGLAELEEAREALAATEQQLGDAERERDEQRQRADDAEALARRLLAEVETAKTALALADERARALEADVETLTRTLTEERAETRELASAALRTGKR